MTNEHLAILDLDPEMDNLALDEPVIPALDRDVDEFMDWACKVATVICAAYIFTKAFQAIAFALGSTR